MEVAGIMVPRAADMVHDRIYFGRCMAHRVAGPGEMVPDVEGGDIELSGDEAAAE